MNGRVIAAVDDLFFAAKIRATAELLGTLVEFVRDAETLLASANASAPALIIFDLHTPRLNPFTVVEQLKALPHLQAIPVIGFFSHVQTELLEHAQQAGFDQVLPRSAFTKQLPEILQGRL